MTTQQNPGVVLVGIIRNADIDIRQILKTLGPNWMDSYKQLFLVRQSAKDLLEDLENIRNVPLENVTLFDNTDRVIWCTYVTKSMACEKS